MQVDTLYGFELLPEDMARNEGAAFVAPVVGGVSWPWQGEPDTMSDPRQSRLILFEDDSQLGPAHVAHGDVRTLGGGRYSQ